MDFILSKDDQHNAVNIWHNTTGSLFWTGSKGKQNLIHDIRIAYWLSAQNHSSVWKVDMPSSWPYGVMVVACSKHKYDLRLSMKWISHLLRDKV